MLIVLHPIALLFHKTLDVMIILYLSVGHCTQMYSCFCLFFFNQFLNILKKKNSFYISGVQLLLFKIKNVFCYRTCKLYEILTLFFDDFM